MRNVIEMGGTVLDLDNIFSCGIELSDAHRVRTNPDMYKIMRVKFFDNTEIVERSYNEERAMQLGKVCEFINDYLSRSKVKIYKF
jgi:hypothetical protein